MLKDPDLRSALGGMAVGIGFLALVLYQLFAGEVAIRNHGSLPLSRGWWILALETAASLFLLIYSGRSLRDNWPPEK